MNVSLRGALVSPRKTTYPFVRLGLESSLIRSSRMMDNERKLRKEPMSYLVGSVDITGHCRRRRRIREWVAATEQTLGRLDIVRNWACGLW